ncbi:hypothetical protein KFJ24_10830 [Marinobacter sediminum]|uniref:hypothetical protein n=1 Tax=Marinobacter sediminum TaxID=256323 RepID=UPI00202EB187|nr:hypothetical protein [Marinobacter sediminum]MCM0612965.1 hypothetical protein [Marinobacter sediminum]
MTGITTAPAAAEPNSLNLATDEAFGRFDPGDSIGFSLGMAIALNLNSSLSFAYDHQFTRRSSVNSRPVPGSYLTTGVLSAGSSYVFSDSVSMDVSIGVGVTVDSPDVQLGFSLPFRMRQ